VLVPPCTEGGVEINASSGETVSRFISCKDPLVARIRTPVSWVTDVDPTGKVALNAPCGTVTVLGTVATKGENIENTVPPVGAGELSVIVPVVPLPPTIPRDVSANDGAALGGLKGARPPGNGRYNGSPTLITSHLIHRVFRKNASPTFAPSS